jgi:hypothetical protein
MMTARELYRFDVQGFLVVREALTQSEVAALNEAIDANRDRLADFTFTDEYTGALAGAPQRIATGQLEWPKPWCDPFRALIAHPRIIGYLNALLGRGWHLDHQSEYREASKGAAGLQFHLGDYYSVDGAFYHYKAGQIRSGLTVLQWILADQGGELGGFACIPGSHKANFPRPTEITHWEQDQDMFVCPEVKAGDLIIFTEACTHGALPWTGEHDRGAILMRYAPRYVQFAAGYHTYELPAWVTELDAAARSVLEPAYIHSNRLAIDADGTVAPDNGIPGDPPPFPNAYDASGTLVETGATTK